MNKVVIGQDTDVSLAGTSDPVIVTTDFEIEVIQELEQGPPGIKGDQGVPGKDGNTILYGTADPQPIDGIDGNFYINTTTNTMFGPKTAGVWPPGNSMVGPIGPIGPTGVRGSLWFEGAGVPGVIGGALAQDNYLNTTNGDVYNYSGSSWGSPVGNIRGPQGIQGIQGPPGSGLADAPSDGTYYARQNAAWVGVNTRFVRYDAAAGLTAAQQLQARQNVFAAPFDAMMNQNLLINGGCDIDNTNNGAWTAFPSVGYPFENWVIAFSASGAAGQAAVYFDGSGGTAAIGYRGRAAFQCSTAKPALAAGDYLVFRQPVEGNRIARLKWGTANAVPITINFWVWSNYAGNYGGYITNQATDRNYTFQWTVNVANTWEYKTVTIPGDQAGVWKIDDTVGLTFGLTLACGSTYQATPTGAWGTGQIKFGVPGNVNLFTTLNNVIYFTGLSILPGSMGPDATQSPMVTRSRDVEMILCQRYWYLIRQGVQFGHGTLRASGGGYSSIPFNTTFRATPSFAWSGGGLLILSGDSSATVNSCSIQYYNQPWISASPLLSASPTPVGSAFVYYVNTGGLAWFDARL